MAESNGSETAASIEGRGPSPGVVRGVVAFVALEFYPATAGGTGILLHHTVASLLRRGYAVHLLVDMQRHEVEKIRHDVRLGFENGDRLSVHLVDDLLVGQRGVALEDVDFPDPEQRRSSRFALALKQLAASTPIDLVEFYDYCGPAYYSLAEAGQGSMPPIAVRLHNTVELIARRIRSPIDPQRLLQFGMERAAITGADLLLAPGEAYFRDEILPLYPEASGVPVQISPPIHAPVGSVAYDPFANDVAFYGRLSTFKGVDTFMRGAVQALEDPGFERWLGRFLIIGPEETVAGGLTVDALRAMVPAAWEDRFVFPGRLSHKQLFPRLRSAAFACFANRIESFCYAAHELATAGLPLILSDTPAFRDHFEAGQEARFFAGTAQSLASEMRSLAANPAARAKLSAAGRAKTAGYDLVDRYAAHIEAARRPPAPASSGRRMLAPSGPLRTALVIFSDGDRTAEARTCESAEGLETLIVALGEEGGWAARDIAGRAVDLNRCRAPDAAHIVRAGDVLLPGWRSAAEAALSARAGAGAVGGWQRRDGILQAPPDPLLPEAAFSSAPGLRMLVRLPEGRCWAEALEPYSPAGDLPLLLAHRAAGRALLALPRPAVDVTQAVCLPAPRLSELVGRDHDRLRPDMLALLAAEGPPDDDHGGDARAVTLADPALVVVEVSAGSGELLLLRAFETSGGLALPWSSAMLEGDWTSVEDNGGPVGGALRTDAGRFSLRLPRGGRIEFLCGPHAGTISVSFRGRTSRHALAATDIGDGAIVVEGDTARFELPHSDTPASSPWALPAPAAAAPVGTLFVASASEDFAGWPHPEIVLPRQVVIQAAGSESDRVRSEPWPADLAERLQAYTTRFGVERLVLSSRLPVTPNLEGALAALPRGVSITLACVEGPAGAAPPAVDRLVAAGRWLGALKRLKRRVELSAGRRSPGPLPAPGTGTEPRRTATPEERENGAGAIRLVAGACPDVPRQDGWSGPSRLRVMGPARGVLARTPRYPHAGPLR
ncbi:MAG: glycosyltransferase, partial [Pseudomonadota bacterium]